MLEGRDGWRAVIGIEIALLPDVLFFSFPAGS